VPGRVLRRAGLRRIPLRRPARASPPSSSRHIGRRSSLALPRASSTKVCSARGASAYRPRLPPAKSCSRACGPRVFLRPAPSCVLAAVVWWSPGAEWLAWGLSPITRLSVPWLRGVAAHLARRLGAARGAPLRDTPAAQGRSRSLKPDRDAGMTAAIGFKNRGRAQKRDRMVAERHDVIGVPRAPERLGGADHGSVS
jgi:hypothetical protein